MIRLLAANIVSAFNDKTIGTKVTDKKRFDEVAEAAVKATDFAAQYTPGQAFIACNDVVPFISAGVGRRSQDEGDYVVRIHRGIADLFLKRENAADVESAALIVYTREAYLADPDVMKDEAELARIQASDATHVLVAVLGFAGPKAPLSPLRLVHNLAGGNNEALLWSADEIRKKAAESKSYWDEWCVVAD